MTAVKPLPTDFETWKDTYWWHGEYKKIRVSNIYKIPNFVVQHMQAYHQLGALGSIYIYIKIHTYLIASPA